MEWLDINPPMWDFEGGIANLPPTIPVLRAWEREREREYLYLLGSLLGLRGGETERV